MIYIVIPVFNRWNYTQTCLESLRNQDNRSFKVIVIDHGSTDNTSEKILSDFPEVILLNGNETMWWTAATNMGVAHAIDQGDADSVLTLNNDTIAEPDYISKLIDAIKSAPKDALIGSTAINFFTKEITYQGERIKWFTESTKFLKKEQRPSNGLLPVSHFPGRGLLVPIHVFLKIGFFDEENFPHYMADYDFTFRATRGGFKIFCSCDAKLATYPEASGANQLKIKRSLFNYNQHLFGMRGGANLPLFFKYTLRNCPWYAIPSHLILGTTRRLLGYWL